MKYKCLALDHDDTVVSSTATIHYPSFIEYLKIYKPQLADKISLEKYFERNFHPGVEALFLEDVGLTEEEFLEEQKFWQDYVKNHIPTAYSGIREVLSEHKKRGGIIAVVSHSYSEYIKRDYEHNRLPAPDIIYGWDMPAENRKPSPYSLLDLMEKYSLKKEEILVIDDLKPGYDMARAAGVDFACAGWGYDVPMIREFMQKNCDFYFDNIKTLYDFLFK